MNKSLRYGFVLSLIFILLFSTVAFAEIEVEGDGYFTVVDEDGNLIFQTDMKVHKGDWYINENNKKYTIIKTNGDQAIAKYEGTVDLTPEDDNLSSALSQPEVLLSEKEAKKEIMIYNTHSDESYVPNSGTHSEAGNGDIYKVADEFAAALKNKGVKVIASNAKHDPHDGGAYERSRRTAKKLTQKGPDALFDIHRDGVPDPSQYLTKINGKKVSQVRLVVGRQNPNMKVNDKFAKQLKSVTDNKYPGLIKGIFYAKGKYNQDLSPRAMLLEFGTHVVSQQDSESAATLFANSVNQLLYGEDAQQTQGEDAGDAGQSRGAWTSLLIIIAVVLVGIAGFLFINEDGWDGVVNRIKHFFGDEFVNYFGFKKEDDEENK
ncbi:stage II sporulation protein P [Selenihalanaerobacter shriftii]|nr:stage II sporulation protein P [Selenihalanaerobacter shriftii]